MKQIEDLKDEDIDRIVGIMLNKEQYNLLITRAEDKKYIIAEYARKRPLPSQENIDYVRMYITIDDQFMIHNRWGYVNETANKGPIGEAISSEPLHRWQYIAKYLIEQGYDIYQTERKDE